MGKGDARLHDRQQCSNTEMELRWKIAFGTKAEKAKAKEDLSVLLSNRST